MVFDVKSGKQSLEAVGLNLLENRLKANITHFHCRIEKVADRLSDYLLASKTRSRNTNLFVNFIFESVKSKLSRFPLEEQP